MTKSGQGCKAWAVRGSDPPLCSAHRAYKEVEPERDKENFYGRTFTLQEVVDLVSQAYDGNLSDEVEAVRVAMRRVLVRLQDELDHDEFARLAGLIFTGANTMVRLMKAELTIRDDQMDIFTKTVYKALDDIASDKDVDLG